MALTKEDQEAVADLLARIREADPDPKPDDPNKEIKKIALLVKHAGSVDRAISVVNAFGTVGRVLKYVLAAIVGVIVLLQLASGQLKVALQSLFTWAGK